MSGSEQHDQVALASADGQAMIGRIVHRILIEVDFTERKAMLEEAQDVLSRVAQYTEPAAMVQRVCDHPAQIIALQKQITDLQTQQLLPPDCNHSTFEQQLETLRQKLEEARRTPRRVGMNEDLRKELDTMTRDARRSGEEVGALRTQLADALSLTAWVAPTPPQQYENRGRKFPDSPDFSGLDHGQLRGWIAQLRTVIRHKPASSPDEQSNMQYTFHCLMGVAMGPILPHVREHGEIGPEGLPAYIQLLEAAFGDPDRVATAERKMREITQKNRKCSQYYAEFQVIAADLHWNPSVLRNALQMGLSDELKDFFTSSNIPDELPAFVTVCQKWDNQIRQPRAEMVAQNMGGGTGFASSPRPPAPPKDPAEAPAGTVAGYTGPAPMDLSAGRRRISAEERAKRFTDGRCLYCGGFNHRAAECAARKKAQMFKAAGAEVKEVRTRAGPEESGKEQVN